MSPPSCERTGFQRGIAVDLAAIQHSPDAQVQPSGGHPLATNNGHRYYAFVIKSIVDRDTERLWRREPSRRLPPDIQRSAYRKLVMLNAATTLNALLVPPANRLERLRGNRAAQHSIRINDQWRICFRWEDGNAWDVEIVDYHR